MFSNRVAPILDKKEERLDCVMPPQEGGEERRWGSMTSWQVQESVMSRMTHSGEKKGLVSSYSHYGRMIKGTQVQKRIRKD